MDGTPHRTPGGRRRRGALAGVAAYLLTAVEAGVLAGVLTFLTGWPLGGTVLLAGALALPLVPLQAWGLYRLQGLRLGPPAGRRPSRRREALAGLATSAGFLLTAPLVLLAGALGAGLLLAGGWAVELGGTGGDLAAALQARAAGLRLADLPRWILVGTAANLLAGFGLLAVGWTLVLGRLRGQTAGVALRHGLALHVPSRTHLLAATLGGLTVGWLPGLVADVLQASSRSLTALRSLGFESTSLAWLDAALAAGTPADRVGVALVVVLLGPVVEEVVFRGFLWSALERWVPRGLVLVLTSAAFALAHLDPVHAPALLLTGLFLGWLRLASGSLLPSLLTHAVNSGLGVLLATASVGPGVATPSAPTGWSLGTLALLVGAVAWTTRSPTRYRTALG